MLQPSELDDGQYGAAVFGEAKERTMPTLMTRFLKNRAGSTAIEYALIGTLVSIAIISGVALMAGRVGEKFDAVAASVQSATKGQ
ncbi:Flp family type IVb pilin [Brucella haematophila]|jgi:pilus assembly protein Flp/PilA|uniref:Flp family type IVb pilin n=1 Tax=Brucella haematophila TaxID=419474 RepID=UPI001F1FED79|nr:Flp family type IVb pilin [Brucella haematophila]